MRLEIGIGTESLSGMTVQSESRTDVAGISCFDFLKIRSCNNLSQGTNLPPYHIIIVRNTHTSCYLSLGISFKKKKMKELLPPSGWHAF